MKSHDKIATRLAMILSRLNQGERFSIDDLVDEFSVTKRTIQRDLNERLSYLPIKKENNLYFLETYYLGKLNFEDIQNFATLSGIKELYPSIGESFLKNILDQTVNKAYLIKGHNYEDLSDKTEEFTLLELAIVETLHVEFTYKDKLRVIKPYKLLNTKGIWYLVGVEANTLKTFSLSKIEALSKTANTFKQNPKIAEQIQDQDNQWFGKEQTEVVLKVNKEVAQFFQRRKIIPNQTIIKNLEDGELLISTKITFDEEILKIVRYWIPHVKIISPTFLQEELERGILGYLGLKTKGVRD